MTAKSISKARLVRQEGSARLRRNSRIVPSHPQGVVNDADGWSGEDVAPASVQTASVKVRRWTVRRAVRWVLGIGALLLLATAGWVAYLLVRFQSVIYHPLPPPPTARVLMVTATPAMEAAIITDTQQVKPDPTPDFMRALPSGRFNILVLGTDKRPNDPEHFARSDTLLLVNVDTVTRGVRIMSIPRDLIVDVPDYGANKVNSAYLFGEYYQLEGGGQALAVRSISQFFNVPIDYYITINFQGFEKIVDTVGGVDVDVPYSIDDYNYPSDDSGDLYGEIQVHFDAGLQHMDGKTALRYARTRHADNDFARSKRQLQIIMAVRQKAMSLDILPSLPSLLDALGGMVETNIPFDEQLALAQLGYGISASNILTSSIDSSIIAPATLPDGSEGLKLNGKAAKPMLDEFFGWNDSSGTTTSSEAVETPTARTSAKTKMTPVPTRAPTTRKP